MKTNLPVFRVKESSVRRRYSDFEWLRNELERDSKVKMTISKDYIVLNKLFCARLPKMITKRLPFRSPTPSTHLAPAGGKFEILVSLIGDP